MYFIFLSTPCYYPHITGLPPRQPCDYLHGPRNTSRTKATKHMDPTRNIIMATARPGWIKTLDWVCSWAIYIFCWVRYHIIKVCAVWWLHKPLPKCHILFMKCSTVTSLEEYESRYIDQKVNIYLLFQCLLFVVISGDCIPFYACMMAVSLDNGMFYCCSKVNSRNEVCGNACRERLAIHMGGVI